MLVKSHLPEYFAEFLGTAIMMIVGIGAVTVMWSDGSVMRELIPNEPLRRLCTGLLFAGGGTAVVLSPLGQRSGGHLNPAVTLAFWVKGQVTGADAIAYCVAQMLGAVMGVVIVALVENVKFRCGTTYLLMLILPQYARTVSGTPPLRQ